MFNTSREGHKLFHESAEEMYGVLAQVRSKKDLFQCKMMYACIGSKGMCLKYVSQSCISLLV